MELDKYTQEINKIIDNLKPTITNKDKCVLKQDDKEKLTAFLDSVSKTNQEYLKIQTLSVSLNNVDTEIKANHEKIQTLTENNEVLTLRIETLTKNIKSRYKEIKEDTFEEYIYYFNNERPAYSLKYKTPIQYKTELGFC